MERKSVYIIKDENKCKVGVSKNPKERLKILQIGNPEMNLIWESRQIFNAYEVERKTHLLYDEFSIGREWFAIKDENALINDIDLLIDKIGIFDIELKERKNNESEMYIVEKILGNTAEKIKKETLLMAEENRKVEDFLYCLMGIKEDCEYTDMIYRCLFGKSAKQLREEFGIGKTDNLRDCLTKEELQAIGSKEMLVSSLIDCGWGYEQIKEFLEINTVKMIS